ncbi:O-acetylhomoserine aminocarboxypropyltransferase/cysteine synthase family protein [Microbacterium marinilacus]|uniref:Bifunctional o-acetylhomoserine/o-acetylserine sulfhydrylase n=1 Tax=Microbacterium marinilacus TaxID=415209 RepID=A0ABP7B476_9MICO|nr:PLP-dependent transferase [Microbacterium marinilacus]MBY0688519.1 aminotransferase class I/II-fold pyridoxal phosphate-dependent enzyme [Microbacterium marinilacus]
MTVILDSTSVGERAHDTAPRQGFSTRQVHAGVRAAAATPRTTPIYLTAGFSFDEYDAAEAHFRDGAGYAYTRIANPTIDTVESRIAELEGGAEALLVASGQAALAVALLSLVSAGGHVVASTHIYEGTRGLLADNLGRFGVSSDFVTDIGDPDAWRAAIRPQTRALVAESLSNARNDVLDIAAIAEVAHEHGIPLVVDNTMATPYLLRPLEHGADIVIHSASKFLAGQGAVIGGVIVDDGRFDIDRSGSLFPHLVERHRLGGPSVAERAAGRARIAYARETVAPRFGSTLSPFNAFLIGQGIETLSLRVGRQSDSALLIARWLEGRDEVESVDYAGLASHPRPDLAERYLPDGHGAVFTFTLRGGAAAARAFVEALQLLTHMTHIGDVRSLVLHPASTSHVNRTPAERLEVGVRPGTLRLSVGIEDAADLREDLARGLAAAREAGA